MTWSPRTLRIALMMLCAAALVIPGLYCGNNDRPPEAGKAVAHGESAWRNVYDSSARYVGMDVCRTCHASVYETFIQTGMGQSFAPATRQKSAADFSPEHAQVYDPALDLHYRPFWNGDSLYFQEFRLDGKDTVHSLTQRIDYVIGSGQHTNSHIFSSNGFLYQAPITFYTQKKKWDLAPGFDRGANSRFSRMIEAECMTCHNGYPKMMEGSVNKYAAVRQGIDCERCHGPGSLHVAEKQAGDIVDTSKSPDYSIVNPRRLSTELQNNICQRCHLQGISVLAESKSFFDFRPGMLLSEMEDVYQPRYEGAADKMIMASHVERMKQSPCYVTSGQMSCITCHNPHISVKVTPRQTFINACGKCHDLTERSERGSGLNADTGHGADGLSPAAAVRRRGCTESPARRAAKNNDCITCHMPQNGSIDIPHVAVTDHYIRRRPVPQGSGVDSVKAFLGLRCYNNERPSAKSAGLAYLSFFETRSAQSGMIDSALRYFAAASLGEGDGGYIHAFFLRKRFDEIIRRAAQLLPDNITDAWTAYRIGEAFQQGGRAQEALPFYQRAAKLLPLALEFQNKLGVCYLSLQEMAEAGQVFSFILSENPNHPLANANLGFIRMQAGDLTNAYGLLNRALELNPDHEQTLINLAVWHHNNRTDDQAARYLRRLLKRNPQHEQAREMLMELTGG